MSKRASNMKLTFKTHLREESADLSAAEIEALNNRLSHAQDMIEQLETLFKTTSRTIGPASKLHHIGTKGGMDMSYFTRIQKLIEDLQSEVDEMHMAWNNWANPVDD